MKNINFAILSQTQVLPLALSCKEMAVGDMQEHMFCLVSVKSRNDI